MRNILFLVTIIMLTSDSKPKPKTTETYPTKEQKYSYCMAKRNDSRLCLKYAFQR